VQQCISGVDESEASETAEQFLALSLAQRDQPEGSIRLHDLQLDYVRAQWPREDREALDLTHGALRLSSNVIAKDAKQFVSQMWDGWCRSNQVSLSLHMFFVRMDENEDSRVGVAAYSIIETGC
jgi:hypothetical protein